VTLLSSLVLAAALAASPLDRVNLGPVGAALFQHMAKGVPQTKMGDWVTYQIDGGPGRTYYWRMSVVGEEKDEKGRDALWIEMDVGQHPDLPAPISQLRMLVAKDAGFTQDGITRMFIAFGFEKPQELGPDALEYLKKTEPNPPPPNAPAPQVPKLWLRTGKDTRLMTHAGTVEAVPVDLMLKSTILKRYWMSRQIPVLQLAKLEIPGISHTMEVRGFGADAKARMVLPGPADPKIRMESQPGAKP
jgi:hypothetical protein